MIYYDNIKLWIYMQGIFFDVLNTVYMVIVKEHQNLENKVENNNRVYYSI